jgi:hypothetical protein
MLGIAGPERRSRVLARWRGSRGPIVLLVVVGVVMAAASRKVTSSFSADVALYEHYANAALSSPLFHSMPHEYPAAALGIFLAPMAFPLPYALAFALIAAIGGLALVLSSDGLPQYPGWARRTCYYLLIGCGAVVFARYDVFPALAAVLAVEGARRERWGRAWAWAVAGGVLKLFPFLLLPGFLLLERAQTGKWALRRVGATGAVVAGVALAQASLSPNSLLSPLRYQLDRGFELSSLQGSASFILDPLHAYWIGGYGTIEVVGRWAGAISVLTTVATLGAMLGVWALARRGQLSVTAVSLAVLSLAVFSEKSFAPQYLVWLMPFWAYWPLRKGWVAAALLTTIVFPVLYVEAQSWGPGFYLPTAIAGVRNVVLVLATALWFREQLRLRHENKSGPVEEMQPDIIKAATSAPASVGT